MGILGLGRGEIAEAYLTVVETINNKPIVLKKTEVHRGKVSLLEHVCNWQGRNLNPNGLTSKSVFLTTAHSLQETVTAG